MSLLQSISLSRTKLLRSAPLNVPLFSAASLSLLRSSPPPSQPRLLHTTAINRPRFATGEERAHPRKNPRFVRTSPPPNPPDGDRMHKILEGRLPGFPRSFPGNNAKGPTHVRIIKFKIRNLFLLLATLLFVSYKFLLAPSKPSVANEQQSDLTRHGDEQDKDKWHVDPSTNLKLPLQIENPISLSSRTGDGPFTLVASGVRTVSFLSIQVYVASLYIPTTHLHKLLSSSSDPSSSSVQDLLKIALEQGVPMVLRITPTRNTDFAHLRDGFARAIQSRLKYARKEQTPPTQDQEEALALSTQAFKELFPKLSLKKGEHLDIVLQSAANNATKNAQPVRAAAANAVAGVDLSLEHNSQVLGSVKYDNKCANLDIGKLLLQAYAADKEPVSQKFKTALEEKLLKR